MKIEVSKSFKKKLSKRIERYSFEVGVLTDKDHKAPLGKGPDGKPQTRDYAGGPVRKQSRVSSGKTVGEILIDNMKRLGINLLSEPFQDKNSDIIKFTEAFLRMATGQKISMKRIENLLQAIVRNPILKKKYGSNSPSATVEKGFDRHLFDTGQMFKNITAKAKRV